MMKNTLIVIFCLFQLNCGKKELHEQVKVLETEIDVLQKENNLLLAELKEMESRVDSVANLPATIFSKSHYYLENMQYRECIDLLIILSEKYPEWEKDQVNKRYNEATIALENYKKEKQRLAEQKERLKKRKAQLLVQLDKNIGAKYDKRKGYTYFTTRRTTICQINRTVSFGLELYMVAKDNGRKSFRLKSAYIEKSQSDYYEPEWMLYNQIELFADNGATMVIDADNSSKKSDQGSFFKKELSDILLDTDNVLEFHDANKVRVFFKGKYLYQFDMTYDQIHAFKEIIAKYDYI
jgi:hypothetical protein|tara:strand:+ start:128 stop:1012 length:885 start_codon:yes stop_codon:yes gene_type:complete